MGPAHIRYFASHSFLQISRGGPYKDSWRHICDREEGGAAKRQIKGTVSNSSLNGTYRKVTANPAGLWLRRDRHQEWGSPEFGCENTNAKINAANGLCTRRILPCALEQANSLT